MNEFNELENELASLQPLPLSASLSERIEATLDRSASEGVPGVASRSRRLLIALSAFALAAAASLAALWFSHSPPPPIPDAPVVFATEQPLAAVFDESLPSLWSYRQSGLHSEAALERLLDKRAHQTTPKPQRAGVYVLTRSDFELNELFGEL